MQDSVVFGVEIPNSDGRAGMAIVANPDNNLDLDNFAAGICKALPSYARPLFLRVAEKLEITGILINKSISQVMVGLNMFFLFWFILLRYLQTQEN